MIKQILALFFCLSFATMGAANNVQVSDPIIKNEFSDAPTIELTVTWENSWRCAPGVAPGNWDAVWIFLKYKRSDIDEWRHLSLKSATSGSLSTNQIPADKLGVMMYRKDAGYGKFSDKITIEWNRVADIEAAARATVAAEICAFAIEMVYVPQGSFYLGDGTDGAGGTKSVLHKNAITPVQPYQVQSEAAVGIGTVNYAAASAPIGILNGKTVTYTTLNVNYPKGFADFYCMKTEISQGQYCAFLNKLGSMQLKPDVDLLYSRTCLELNDEITLKKFGNTITKNNFGVYEVGDPYRACNFLTSHKVLAYLSWSALRPMTMLEYEKACRGHNPPRPYEYAWGRGTPTNLPADKFSTATDENEVYERTDGKDPNYYISKIARTSEGAEGSPGRVGAFAKENTNRVEAGASYYGILDLSGGLAELVVSWYLGTVDASGYQGRIRHGNGTPLVDISGNTTWVQYWPLINSASSYQTGYAHRGGHFMCVEPAAGVTVNNYDPSNGEVSTLSKLGYNGSGTKNIWYIAEYDYSYGHNASGTLDKVNTRYLQGYGGRGVRNF